MPALALHKVMAYSEFAQPVQHPVHCEKRQRRFGQALHQHHRVVAKPAQRNAATRLKQNHSHTQFQQKK